MPDQYNDIQDWATEGGGEGDPASSASSIQNYVESFISDLGTLHNDTSTLPTTSSERANGTFYDLNDLIRYLDGGGLIFRDEDGEFVPNPIIHIVRTEDEFYDKVLYTVWIDDNS